MKDMITIIKKELYRVFKDPKLVLTMFILPGLMIFGLYALMGNAMDSLMTGSEEKELTIYYVNEKPAHEITIGGVKVTFEGDKDGVVVSQSYPEAKRIDLINGSVVLTLKSSKTTTVKDDDKKDNKDKDDKKDNEDDNKKPSTDDSDDKTDTPDKDKPSSGEQPDE